MQNMKIYMISDEGAVVNYYELQYSIMNEAGSETYSGTSSNILINETSITVENLRPPNRKNTTRTKKRAMERFEEDVAHIVKKILTTEYHHLFHSEKSRENYSKKLGKV